MTCPNCSVEDFIVSFFWGTEEDKGIDPYHHMHPFFKFEKTLPWGKEYVSTCCGTHWLRLENCMYLISPKQKKYFDEALQHNHHLSDDLQKILGAIGYTHIYGNKMGPFHYPCAITLKTGQVIECATLVLGGLNSAFFNHFPFEAYYENLPYYFIDEISSLRPSRYACSSEVRAYSRKCDRSYAGLSNRRGDVYICWYYVEFSQIPQEGDTLFYPCELVLKSSAIEDRPDNVPEALSQAFVFVHDPRFQSNVGTGGLAWRLNDTLEYESGFITKAKYKE